MEIFLLLIPFRKNGILKLIGLQFRKVTASIFSDPTIECFDPAYVTDRKGTYQTFFTDVDFGILGYTDVSNSAESPLRNSRNYQSNAVKAVIESVSEKHTAKSGWNLWRKRLESRVRAYTGKHEVIM